MDEGNSKILVVDDDAFVREILEFVLQSAGYLVEVAGDGTEALHKCLSDAGIDLVVTDIRMPGMGGVELTRELRGHGIDLPIVLLTGDSEVAAAVEAVTDGATDYLIKDEDVQDKILILAEKMLKEHRLRTSGY